MASGGRPATLDNVLPSLTLNPRVIELDQSQPGGSFDSPIPPFEPYRLTHVDNARISRGRVAYHANRQTLRAIEQETGVPEAVMEIGRAHVELQSLMRNSYAVFCLKKKKI